MSPVMIMRDRCTHECYATTACANGQQSHGHDQAWGRLSACTVVPAGPPGARSVLLAGCPLCTGRGRWRLTLVVALLLGDELASWCCVMLTR
jgi:hypothetical protein